MSEPFNYFNYFTEIEEHFQKARGTSLFLLSPLDWALIESWKNSGVPLEAVLHGIDAAFEKWRGRRNKIQQVNSLAFCAQAVLTEAQRGPRPEPRPNSGNALESAQIQSFLEHNLEVLREMPKYSGIADDLAMLATGSYHDLEDLEQRLSVVEQRMIAIARAGDSAEDAVSDARALEAQLRPYRSKMSAPQLDMLQRQFLERKLLEREKLPRLSLFYIR